MTEKQPPVHADDCHYKDTKDTYTVGCVGCVHQLILDSKIALTKEYTDNLKEMNKEQKQSMEERLEVYIYLEGMFP